MNPLFVDSTKAVSGQVVTQIEIIDVTLGDGDILFVEILDALNSASRYKMQQFKTKKSIRNRVDIFLNDKSQTKYRYFIETSGRMTFCSQYKSINSGDTICDSWKSLAQDETALKPHLGGKFKSQKLRKSETLLSKDLLEKIKLFVD